MYGADKFATNTPRPQRRLAFCIAALLGVSSPAAFAASVYVTNCNNSGAGSLRSAVAAAVSGNTIDLTGLTTTSTGCASSAITLTTGAITVPQNSLTLQGPAAGILITGKYHGSIENDRIFNHTGTGTFAAEHVDVAFGHVSSASANANGGCIYSSGSVVLIDSNVTGCYLYSKNTAEGGGLFSKGATSLLNSHVENNDAVANINTGDSLAGGVFAKGGFSSLYSTISGNTAIEVGAVYSGGGPLYLLGSTVSNNKATLDFGGLRVNTVGSAVVVNSTISNNSAGTSGGALTIYGKTTALYNSTIAFNTSKSGYYGAGVHVGSGGQSGATLTLNSVLASNNMSGSAPVGSDLVDSNVTVTGSHNLVYASSSQLPSGTIVGKCPMLGSLKSNGGATNTIALQSHSPALDAGNVVFMNPLPNDQRQSPFKRVSGAAADIGAYEIDQSEIIFTANFEGCP